MSRELFYHYFHLVPVKANGANLAQTSLNYDPLLVFLLNKVVHKTYSREHRYFLQIHYIFPNDTEWQWWYLRLKIYLHQWLLITSCIQCPGLPRDHPESYHSFMWNNFFKHIDIVPENTHILDGNAADLVKECNAFEEKISAAGGIELFVGGQEFTGLTEHLLLIK